MLRPEGVKRRLSVAAETTSLTLSSVISRGESGGELLEELPWQAVRLSRAAVHRGAQIVCG